MKKLSLEFVVGIFILLGMGAMAYLSFTLAGVSSLSNDSYQLTARFENVSGLKQGAVIEVAGVRVGKVDSIGLDYESFESVVVLTLNKKVEVTEDSIASIRTSGIIGDKFIKITPGGSELILENGEEIIETEPSISIEELVSKYIFDS